MKRPVYYKEEILCKDKQRCHRTQGLSCRRGALWRKNKQYRKKDIAIITAKSPAQQQRFIHRIRFRRTHHCNQTKHCGRHGAGSCLQQRQCEHLQCRRRGKGRKNVCSGSKSTASEAEGYHRSLYRCHRAGASHRAHRKGHCGTGVPSFPERAIWMPCRQS